MYQYCQYIILIQVFYKSFAPIVRGKLVLYCLGFVNLHQYTLPMLMKLKPLIKTINVDIVVFVLEEVFTSEISLTF